MTDLISYTMTRSDLEVVLSMWEFEKGRFDYYYMKGLPKGIELGFKPHIKQPGFSRDFVSFRYEYNTPKLGNGGVGIPETSLDELIKDLKRYRKIIFPNESEYKQLSIFDLE